MRSNRRRGAGWSEALGWALRAGRILPILAAVWFVTGRGVGWVKGHPYFAVREIDVESRGALDARTLLSWAGLANGMSIWDVGERQAEARLLEHPRVRAAFVERELPGFVRLRVEQREPVALLLGDPVGMVSLDGVVFPPSDGESLVGLPYVSGFAGRDLASGRSTTRLRDAARLAATWQTHEQWPAISEIRPDADELVVFAAGSPLAVRFSASAGADDFARLGTVFDLWKGRERGLVAVDLSMAGEAVLKVRKTKPVAPPSRTSAKAPPRKRPPAPRGILSVADRQPGGRRAHGPGGSST